jgi:hypothetical protein
MLLVLPLPQAATAATARSAAWPSILPTLLRRLLLLLLLLASTLAWDASELLVQGVFAVAVISLGRWGIFVGVEGIIIVIVTGNILHTESRCRHRGTYVMQGLSLTAAGLTAAGGLVALVRTITTVTSTEAAAI